MPRAFLSHSTDDKPYVDEVAKYLGRPRTTIDSQAFRPGEDFRQAIRRSLDDSDVFVIFVSPKSLASSWVQFEVDEAELRAIRGTLRRSIAIFIDGPVSPSDLPVWLSRVRAVPHTSPAQSARTIESLLFNSSDHQRPFIGRNEDLQRGVRKLSTDDPLPRIAIISGLEGVGRRSYLARLLKDALSLDLGPIIVLPTTATLEDLFIQSHPTMLTRADAERQLETFRSFPQREQASEVARQLAFLAQQGGAPCIVDRGAMLNSGGTYTEDYGFVIEDFLSVPDIYLCLIHTRAPEVRKLPFASHALERRLRPLQTPDTQALIVRLLLDANIRVAADKSERLAEVAGGFPPAAYFLVAQIEDYGVDVVLNDPARTADFHSRSFSRFLRDLKLPPVERELLVYLASESKLTLAGLAAATGHSLERTAAAVRSLVDLSIVENVDDEYSVTAPIQKTVVRSEGAHNRKWYEAAFARLENEYWTDERTLPALSVVDATLRAGLRIGLQGTAGRGSLVRPSLLIYAAQEMYHRRDHESALEYLVRAENLGGRTTQLLELKVKCLAQLERFGDARKSLNDYRNSGERRQWYLDGFIERKARNHSQACAKFQRGYAKGDRSISLLRDYADSLLRTHALEEAASIANEALDRERGNVYILDLVVRISLAVGSTDEIEQALNALEAADLDEDFILYRRASFLLQRRGNSEAIRAAVTLAERAVSKRNAPLEAFAVLARALIRSKEWARLEKVKDDIHKKQKKDGRFVLRRIDLYAAMERSDWRRADKFLPERPTTAEDRALRAAVLDLKSVDYAVLLDERQEAKKEAAALRQGGGQGTPGPMDLDLYE